MTRKSERELERAVDDLGPGDEPVDWESTRVVIVDPETGEHRTPEGDVVDPEASADAALTVSIGGDPDR